MTTGALIFAHNNPIIDYTKLAVFAANRVKQNLDIPVSIVTDNKDWLLEKYTNHPFDQIIEVSCEMPSHRYFYDGALSAKEEEWNNLTRYRAYDLTPYDKTLVIDSDYIVNSNVLKLALQRDEVFQMYNKSFDLAMWRDRECFTKVSPYSIPFYWATVFIFEKNDVTKAFFDLVSYIKLNYQYFRMLYLIEGTSFRNDYAFSIAVHIMNGKTNGEFVTELPGIMTYIHDRDLLVGLDENKLQFLVEKEHHYGEYLAVKTTGIDVHVMNKMSLSRIIDEGNYV